MSGYHTGRTGRRRLAGSPSSPGFSFAFPASSSQSFGRGASLPYDRACARDYHPGGRDNPAPGHQGHCDAHRAEPGPPPQQYREAHPDNRGENNSVDHDPGEASEQVVFPTSPTIAHEQQWGERPEDPHWDQRYDQKRRTDYGFVLAAEPDELVGGHDSQVQDEPGGSATQLLGHTELLAAPCLSEYCGDPDRHRDSPDQKCAETEEGPDVLYAGGGSECLAHADVERVMEAEIANEQVTYAGIACES